jgi:hypothetical protein
MGKESQLQAMEICVHPERMDEKPSAQKEVIPSPAERRSILMNR